MEALLLPGARRSLWFADQFDGRLFDRLEKILLHSTETDKRGDCPGYDQGRKAPTLTVNPWPGYMRTWQHFPINESSRALLNPTSTSVSENKDNVCQIEIIGYSDRKYGIPRGCYLPDLPAAGLDYLARILATIAGEWDVPNTWASPWPAYPTSYGNSPARMSSSQYDRFRGFLGHLHASGNTHGDVTIDVAGLRSRVERILNPPIPAPPNVAGQEVAVFLVQLKGKAPVYKSDGFQRIHVSKVERDALVRAGVKQSVVTTQEALDAFGPEIKETP